MWGKFQLVIAATVMGLVSSWLLYGAALKGEAGHGALYKESLNG